MKPCQRSKTGLPIPGRTPDSSTPSPTAGILKNTATALAVALGLGLAATSHAAVIANYNFTTDSNSVAAPVVGIINVTAFYETGAGHQGNAGSLGYTSWTGDDNAGRSGDQNYYFRQSAGDGETLEHAIHGGNQPSNPQAPVNSGNDYSGFSITVDPGYVLNVTSLTFDTVANGGPGWVSVLTSVRGFTADRSEGDFQFTNSSTPRSVAGVQAGGFDALGAGTYEFRFYTYEGDSTFEYNNPSRLDNVVLSGEVTVVPEPATLSLLGVGAAAAMRRRRVH